jgi:hypothetical protein
LVEGLPVSGGRLLVLGFWEPTILLGDQIISITLSSRCGLVEKNGMVRL